jgi:hypothetical protein
MFPHYLTNSRHRKTHERSGSTRNTPCDSSRNTPVSGDDELDPHRSDESQHDEQLFRYPTNTEVEQDNHVNTEYPQHPPLHQGHFRSFSHEGHLNHYTMAPTSHSLSNLHVMRHATPPNEIEEDPSHAGEDNSPPDTDSTNSYHEELPPNYAHQTTYHGIPVGNGSLNVSSNGDIITSPKTELAMMETDPLRKHYLSHPQMMEPPMMDQGWGYH